MTEHSIPVDIFNPGQVFASMGFMEAADVLIGGVEGGFDWSDEANVRFILRTQAEKNPFEEVLDFLQKAEIIEQNESYEDVFPSRCGNDMALPCILRDKLHIIRVSHWADDSSRKSFKLYAGNRSAVDIARVMLYGAKKEKTNGIAQLLKNQRNDLVNNPFNILTPLGGSFNFDPRGAWTTIDVGYSLNDVKHEVNSSPVVEMLAAIGLEYARPDEYSTRQVRYGVWQEIVPPSLARASIMGAPNGLTIRIFNFELALAGKNKIITYAKEVKHYE